MTTETRPTPAALLPIAEVAALLQVSERTLKLWDARGELPAGLVVRLGGRGKRTGRRMFSAARLARWVEEGCPMGAGEQPRRKRRA